MATDDKTLKRTIPAKRPSASRNIQIAFNDKECLGRWIRRICLQSSFQFLQRCRYKIISQGNHIRTDWISVFVTMSAEGIIILVTGSCKKEDKATQK